jgi:hypothetical protein
MITVETTESSFRVTIPRNEIPLTRLNSLLDWLRLEALAARSALTEGECNRMAEQAEADWWAANKARFIRQEAKGFEAFHRPS